MRRRSLAIPSAVPMPAGAALTKYGGDFLLLNLGKAFVPGWTGRRVSAGGAS